MSIQPSPAIAMIPDSAEARLLIELTSHATDLSEASHTLRLAIGAGEDSELWLPLTMHAVTAYSRPFAVSKVRSRLDTMDQFPGVPTGFKPVHYMVRNYRNTTVAHSQSDLVLPIALAILDDSGAVRDVVGMTFVQPMPLAVAERFAELIDAIATLVEEATEPVSERLRIALAEVAPLVVAGWPKPDFSGAADHEFAGARARTRRSRFTTYWRTDVTATAAQGEAVDS